MLSDYILDKLTRDTERLQIGHLGFEALFWGPLIPVLTKSLWLGAVATK
tara:strand:- start:424 stop:570 length:147 start_codon:yes stop_codon:yes gene_type:complete